jgi:hypothetical protein
MTESEIRVEDYDCGPLNGEACTTCQRGEWYGRKAVARRADLGCPNPGCADYKGRKHVVPGFVRLANDATEPEVYLWTTPEEAAVLTADTESGDLTLLTDDAWVARFAKRARQFTASLSSTERVKVSGSAPGAFLRDTGREPPHDLIARVFAALAPPADTSGCCYGAPGGCPNHRQP